MSFFESAAAIVGVKPTTMLAAFFGALVSFPFIRAPEDYVGAHVALYKIYVVGSGMACAVFIGPSVALHGGYERMESAIVFFIGMSGMAVASAIWRALSQVDLTTLSDIIGNWISGARKGGKE